MGLSRLVTLPDWQGLGLAFVLSEMLGAAFKAIGKRFHNYPAHPSFIRNYGEKWRMIKRPGVMDTHITRDGRHRQSRHKHIEGIWNVGGRPCAVFQYVGEAMDRLTALKLLDYDKAVLANG
jgi:hypothetical protein